MRLILLVMLVTLAFSAAAEPAVVALPEGCICLDIITLPDGGHLLLLGDEPENAVRLAAADGQEITAMTGPLLPLADYDPGLAYFTVDWRDDAPIFWWGTSNVVRTRELYIRLAETDGGWHVTSGYVYDPFTPVKYTFSQQEPGLLWVSGDLPYPEIEWPTDISMALDGFDPDALEQVCLKALAYLEDFSMNHTVDEQDEKYRINW